MAYAIHYKMARRHLKRPVNRNFHDHVYWLLVCDIAQDARVECAALEEDWHTHKTIHDLYEIYNAPHVSLEERRTQAARYIVNKQFTLAQQHKAHYPERARQAGFDRRLPALPPVTKPVTDEIEPVSWSDLLK